MLNLRGPEATHTEEAAWRLVDFNDRKLGRPTLIRDLLDVSILFGCLWPD